MSNRTHSVLTIAGSDSGGGAGIQADLKTFAALGIHGLSVITAVTAQNTRAVRAAQCLSVAMIQSQLDAVFEDFDIRAIKIGMLGDTRTIRAVVNGLQRHNSKRRIPVVLDPVMIASSGASLLKLSAITALKRELMPEADLITPNLPEAEALLHRPIRSVRDMSSAAADLLQWGSSAVLVKGGHLKRGPMVDLLFDGQSHYSFEHQRLSVSGHGTGCTLSSAIAANLAQGLAMADAVGRACTYVHDALQRAHRPGKGKVAVLGHFPE